MKSDCSPWRIYDRTSIVTSAHAAYDLYTICTYHINNRIDSYSNLFILFSFLVGFSSLSPT